MNEKELREFLEERFAHYIERKRYNQNCRSDSQDGLWSAGECSEAEAWLNFFGVDTSYEIVQPMVDKATPVELRFKEENAMEEEITSEITVGGWEWHDVEKYERLLDQIRPFLGETDQKTLDQMRHDLEFPSDLLAQEEAEFQLNELGVENVEDYCRLAQLYQEQDWFPCDGVDTADLAKQYLKEKKSGNLTGKCLDDHLTGKQIRTPRGTFFEIALSMDEMRAAGYGVHHASEDGRYLIVTNGSRAYAVKTQE